MNFTLALLITVSNILVTQGSFAQNSKAANSAAATLKAAPGQNLKGDVSFKGTDSGIEVSVNVSGLQPGAVHAMHIHENGKCDAPKFESAGGHFNPTKEPHAHPAAKQSHIGDLGNIVADKNGNAKLDLVMARAKFSDQTSPINKAVIVHAKPDDLRSQPSGEAGDRIACGVVTAK